MYGFGGLSVEFTQGKDVSGYWLPFAWKRLARVSSMISFHIFLPAAAESSSSSAAPTASPAPAPAGNGLIVNFSYVCPEPVLANIRFSL